MVRYLKMPQRIKKLKRKESIEERSSEHSDLMPNILSKKCSEDIDRFILEMILSQLILNISML